jgi:hypothetical protein
MEGWSEPAATNAPVQDEAVLVVLGMHQKHILFPCPRIFQPPSLPQNFPLLPIFPLSYLPLPSYLPHFISHSLHLQSSRELLSLSSTKLRGDIDTRHEKGGESSTLKECGEEKTRGMLHPKCRSKRRKVSFLPSLHVFSSLWFFFSLCFFSLCLRRKKCQEKTLETKGQK